YRLTSGPPEKELARRIVLVTGAGSGIGCAIARRLAVEGAHAVAGDVDGASARRTVEDIAKAVGGVRALGLEMDVTSEASVRAALDRMLLVYAGPTRPPARAS